VCRQCAPRISLCGSDRVLLPALVSLNGLAHDLGMAPSIKVQALAAKAAPPAGENVQSGLSWQLSAARGGQG
jgi:hypothetical protein